MKRRFGKVIALLVVLVSPMRSGVARADVTVPVHLQAQLVSKIGAFDRNFAARAGDSARVLVVERSGDDDSIDVGTHFARALEDVHKIGATVAEVEVLAFTTAASLAEHCRTQKVSVVYLSTRLDADVGLIANALSGVVVLTVVASAAYAARGTVVGFDLEEGKPRIVINLGRAKAQNVSFRAELLKLARLVTSD